MTEQAFSPSTAHTLLPQAFSAVLAWFRFRQPGPFCYGRWYDRKAMNGHTNHGSGITNEQETCSVLSDCLLHKFTHRLHIKRRFHFNRGGALASFHVSLDQ